MEHQSEAFCRRFPFELIPTNIHGVYTTPAFLEDLDPNTASTTTLIKHGLLWPRPSEVDDPGIKTLWEEVFSRQWQAKDRIYPHLVLQPDKTHILRKSEKKTDSSFNSNNWSGASIKGNWLSCVGSRRFLLSASHKNP